MYFLSNYFILPPVQLNKNISLSFSTLNKYNLSYLQINLGNLNSAISLSAIMLKPNDCLQPVCLRLHAIYVVSTPSPHPVLKPHDLI